MKKTLAAKLVLLVALAALLVALPMMLNLFQTLLGDKIDTEGTIENRDAMINGGIWQFFLLYCYLVGALMAANVIFLVVEHMRYEGNYLRFGLQALVNVVMFAVALFVALALFPGLYAASGLVLFEGASLVMFISLTVAFVLSALSALFILPPTNRRGLPVARGITLSPWLY